MVEDGAPGHKACQKIPRVEWNGCASLACTVARSQLYRGTMGRHGGRARAYLGRVSDPETLEAAVNAA